MPTPLAGAVAVVTGASGNLGPVWIRALGDAGARVVGIDLVAGDVDGAERVEVADVRDRAALDAIAAVLRDEGMVPEVLVNNAGIDQPPAAGVGCAAVEDVPLPDFLRVLDVNVAGAFNTMQVFGGAMARAGRGSIVNVGSLYASLAPDPAFYAHMEPPFLKPPAYGASKAALVNLTRYFARLWGDRGVRVNALSPGGVRGSQDAEFISRFTARVPLGRLAEAGDLTGPLLFLASDASRYVTGQDLRVDGGFTA
ncbi:SDR family oxidoreductase [Svornostia abyssi]|uniref:SDR family oxidoreductase n=1 Tax=Svornostia abyssi TaxID=2898438 RepID=A0ABY5PLW2_9ACTN|nr:SDR family oxidoreductase [Parviterribacteraceae bacterium J379]